MAANSTSATSAPAKKVWSRGIEILDTVDQDIELGQQGACVTLLKTMEVSHDLVVQGDLMVMGWVRVEERMNKAIDDCIEVGGDVPGTQAVYLKTRVGPDGEAAFNPAPFAIKNQAFEQGFRSLSKDKTVVVKGDLDIKGNLTVFGNLKVEGEFLVRSINEVYIGDLELLES